LSAEKSLFGHPRGLAILFLTEMWQIFSLFGMGTILVYYMIFELHLGQGTASQIYGLYAGVASLSPLLGGLLGDMLLGPRRAIIGGCLLMLAGFLLLAFEESLYIALLTVALGSGLYSPNFPSQIDMLYRKDDPRRAQAYNIYYVGINLGAFLAPFVTGTVAERYGWHFGFMVAAIGMLIGLLTYLFLDRARLLHPVLAEPPRQQQNASNGHLSRAAVIPLVGIWLSALIVRIAYGQMGNTIPLWIETTNRRLGEFLIPMTWFQSLNPLFIFLGTPVLLAVWSAAKQRGTNIGVVAKLLMGSCLIGLSFSVAAIACAWGQISGGGVSATWVVALFLLGTFGELCIFPTGLALFSLLAPRGFQGITISLWYLCGAPASLMSGLLGQWWTPLGPTTFFLLLSGIAFLSAVLLVGIATGPSARWT
jgi:proton-dependent oligopeptide transporter, POT family